MSDVQVHLRGVSNKGLAEGELPIRIKILAWGSNPSQVGDVRVTDVTLAALRAQADGRVFDRIRLDFEHNSEPGAANFQPPPRKHAGYGLLEVVPGDGIYLSGIVWTPAGKEFAREYSDLSPTVKLNAAGEVVFVSSVALCPNGAVHDLSFYSGNANAAQHRGEPVMDGWKKFLCGLMGKDESTSDADLSAGFKAFLTAEIGAAVKALQTLVTDLSGKVVALEAKMPAPVADERIATLVADVAALRAQTAQYEKDIVRRDREAVLLAAAREGKVVSLSAEAVEKLSVADLRAHVAAIPVTVPLDQRTPERIQMLSAAAADVSALEKVARACGLDPAKIK